MREIRITEAIDKIIFISVTVLVVFIMAVFSSFAMVGEGGGTSGASGAEAPDAKHISYELSDGFFTTNDPMIRMIEINQSLSYGFDTETGECFLLESFVAGKATAIFIDLTKPPAQEDRFSLTVERDGNHIAELLSYRMVDDTTILFQPNNMAEIGNWQKGNYTFTFRMGDSAAVRTAVFLESMPIRILAVPILANYSGRIVGCADDWKNGAQLIAAMFPVAEADVEYVHWPELDLSDDKYDLDKEEGAYLAWRELKKLQTLQNDYTLILGFIRERAQSGQYLGFTFGLPVSIVCESEPDMPVTVVHEVSHCYYIGDEYEGGDINNALNAPPYLMSGYDIITKQPAFGMKEAVAGSMQYGINSSGSVIYPEQRAYRVDEGELLGAVSSYMGAGFGAPPSSYWITSDIWLYLFDLFTNRSSWVAQNLDEGIGDFVGECYWCFENFSDSVFYLNCLNCYEFVRYDGQSSDCGSCGMSWDIDGYTVYDVYLYHYECGNTLSYSAFLQYNSNPKNTERPAYLGP